MEEKLFINPEDLLEGAFNLGKKIFDSGFKPDFLIGIWRGGTPVGIAVQEYLEYKKIKTDHIAIRTSGYNPGIDKRKANITVHNLGYILERVTKKNKLLIVDDVFDTGLTIKSVLESLKNKLKENYPKQIKVATIYYKPTKNLTNLKPDFYLKETDKWIIFPHELVGLTKKEIKENKNIDLS
tara:strand:- start:75298 stop:75843 length:546 start_codon:yes stop_codon:yes gene_type:complete